MPRPRLLPKATMGVGAEKRAQLLSAIRTQFLAHPSNSPTILDLFACNSERFKHFSCRFQDCLFDYSKTHLTLAARTALLEWLCSCGFMTQRAALFSGEIVNPTERRAALHTALRDKTRRPMWVGGHDIRGVILETLNRMQDFAENLRKGTYKSSTGASFSDIVHIGIGGSDLAPRMAARALCGKQGNRAGSLRVHYLSDLEGEDLATLCRKLDPARSFVLINSKSFITRETCVNAECIRQWLVAQLGKDAAQAHYGAVTAAPERARAFGVSPELIFEFWEWVGGRYALWGALGLSLMLLIGPEKFLSFLEGAYALDQHFLEAPLDENLPVIMGLVSVWHRTVLGHPTLAVLPYAAELALFPSYLQQLDMESNGKSVSLEGKTLPYATAPVLWGGQGIEGQHAFYQMLHQGTDVVPCEFLMTATPVQDICAHEGDCVCGNRHALLVANCLAQSEALMCGYTDTAHPHQICPGNRPSTTLLYEKTTPFSLGRLLALYEHRCFVQGIFWGVNSFDQWGVDYGKKMAGDLLPALLSEKTPCSENASTQGLVQHFKALRDTRSEN